MSDDEASRYARFHAILMGARSLTGDSLEAYLASACADDRALRSEVEECLAAGSDDAADDLLAEGNLRGVRLALEGMLPGGIDAGPVNGVERFDQLLEQARQLPPEQRPAFLEQTRERDPDLARALERRLALGSEGEGEGEETASGVVARLGARAHTRLRYAVEGKVSEGGQGTIYRVWDEDLQRSLAMKVMRARGGTQATDPDTLSLGRFLGEAQVTGQLEHPGIVPVHELGLDAQGRVYFTMRLVDGMTLSTVFEHARLGRDGWTQTRALGVLLRVCEAMAYAHDKGVIHRDLKPSNVMVGRFGEVFVMDWGLARVLGREDQRDLRLEPAGSGERRSGSSALLTMDGAVIGTPHYMAPEQARGQVEQMGPHSDVYSLGAMLYELLAGRAPYVDGETSRAAHEIVLLVQEGPPEALTRSATRAPDELVAICERAMQRLPERRYPDVAALAEDLAAFLEKRVVSAYETGALAQLRKWVVRNRALAAAFAAVMLAVVVGLFVALVLKARADRSADLASQRGDALQRANQDLEQRRLEAERSRDEILRLSALQDVEDLLLTADSLWPATPDKASAYAEWIARARALVFDLPLHRAKRDELSPGAEGQARWWSNQLTKLIDELEILAGLLAEDPGAVSAEHGWSVPRRMAFAERLRAGHASGGELARRWEEALPALRAAYPGLDPVPQLGLLPLGPDPRSGLWEFGELATGEPPQRGADGELAWTEASGLVLVLVPGGTFTMGAQSSDATGANHDPAAQAEQGPVHEVALSPFLLSKYEMTQAQWSRFMGHNPSVYDPSNPLVSSLLHPVETVDWHACTQACARLGLSLPTEAQWEYAARAGATSPWWTGAERESLSTRAAANVADRSARRGTSWTVLFEDWDDGAVLHAAVGSYAPNAFGLHDVHGNVWEWTRDAFSTDFYASTQTRDPHNAPSESSRLVYRGGSFNAPAASARLAYRDYDAPTLAHNSTGFRPGRDWTR